MLSEDGKRFTVQEEEVDAIMNVQASWNEEPNWNDNDECLGICYTVTGHKFGSILGRVPEGFCSDLCPSTVSGAMTIAKLACLYMVSSRLAILGAEYVGARERCYNFSSAPPTSEDPRSRLLSCLEPETEAVTTNGD